MRVKIVLVERGIDEFELRHLLGRIVYGVTSHWRDGNYLKQIRNKNSFR